MASVLDILQSSIGNIVNTAESTLADVGSAAGDKARQTVKETIAGIGPKKNSSVDSVTSSIKPSSVATPTTTTLANIVNSSSKNTVLALAAVGVLLLILFRKHL